MYSLPTSLTNVTCKGSLFGWGEFSFLTKWCFKSRSQLSFLCVWQWLSVLGIPPSETSSWTGGMTSPSAEDIPGRAVGVRITLHQICVRPVWASVGVCDHRDIVWVSVTHVPQLCLICVPSCSCTHHDVKNVVYHICRCNTGLTHRFYHFHTFMHTHNLSIAC